LASLATRKINMRSKGHSSGFIMIATKARPWPRKVFYESWLERNFAVTAAIQENVIDIIEQPQAVTFTRACGKPGKHTFDFLVKLEDGTSIAVAIKPLKRVEQLNFRATLELIKAATPKSFADNVMLITDKHIDADAAREATRALMMRNRSLMEAAP